MTQPTKDVIQQPLFPQNINPTFAPLFPPSMGQIVDEGFEEWFRAKVGPEKQVLIYFRGEGEITPKEIGKLIAMLQAQKAALEDD